MRILGELEGRPRGVCQRRMPGFDGMVDPATAIRTVVLDEARMIASFFFGWAVVALSDAQGEYERRASRPRIAAAGLRWSPTIHSAADDRGMV